MSTNAHVEPDQNPAEPAVDTTVDEDDVEGHSLLNVQFGQQVATNRSRDAAEWARGEKARREAEKAQKREKGR